MRWPPAIADTRRPQELTIPPAALLKTQLEGIVLRLHNKGEVPQVIFAGGDFLDVAQGIEPQELARLQHGEYGVCADCGAPIPPKRLLALPDTTTCVAGQERLERVGQR